MALTFLFAETLNETGCVSVRLETDGSIGAPLEYRTVEDIKKLQLASSTIIIVSTAHCGLHQVELPWLGEAKARAAIPYALEEHLAQKLSTLHFAFDREHHQNNRYLVAVIDRTYLANLMSQLTEMGIEFDEITLDWFALELGDICVTSSIVLCHDDRFQGALSFDVANTYLNTQLKSTPVLTFIDSPSAWHHSGNTAVDSPFLLWVAERLVKKPRLNLCQGEFRHVHKEEFSRKWIKISLLMVAFWLMTVMGIHVINLVRLNHQIRQLDEDIAVVYRQFFPNAQQVISPRFRISQLLKSGQSTQSSMVLWQLLDKFDQAVKLNELTIEQLNYKDKVLSVTLNGRDFNVLENLSERLKRAHVRVAQTQATSRKHGVTAIMELRL